MGITPEEELGETFFENSLQKARVANAASGKLSLGDDSGLIVPALNNLPVYAQLDMLMNVQPTRKIGYSLNKNLKNLN